ncbi:MAG: S-adenosylmethionine:tRNA ribosyltransferase-isomerase, partial [Candidatus Omnitrophica bacterium]|nr:S-adenosylmethionine:tRNA ribosyltransferase-isomerase [Candidatus Omnitrophota bacterium]
MELKDFNYDLPQELIAQKPLHCRDNARLMIIDRKTGDIRHDIFRNLDKYLPDNSCLVFNESKVIPARLLGKREQSGGNVEIFLLKELEDGYTFKVLMRPLKRLKLGEKVYFDNGRIVVEIIDKEEPKVRFNKKNVLRYLEKIGHIPLPPYIKRDSTVEDRKYYQT